MITCKQASQLLSQSLDRQLSWRERLVLRFHLLLCDACKRFARQIVLLGNTVKQVFQKIEQDEHLQLPQEARERITAAVESHST